MAYTPLAQTFFFDSFGVNTARGEVVFSYSTDAGHHFTHTLSMAFPSDANAEAVAPAVFALGMAELPSYWKAILAPSIVIKAGALDETQIAFWENLYTKGLGEFFYVNQIDFRGLVNIRSDLSAPRLAVSSRIGASALVPLGGGKDSLVTAELLKKQGNGKW